jgi:glutaredoxin
MEFSMKKLFLFSAALFMMFAGASFAEFYTWEDEHGVAHITDFPPPAHLKGQNIQRHSDGDPADNSEQYTAQKGKTPIIELYTKNDCPDCEKAKEFLRTKGLAFTEYNMDEDKTAALRRKDIDDSDDAPFAIINRIQVYGFTEAIYSRALKAMP